MPNRERAAAKEGKLIDMSGAAKKILESALSLPPEEREYIADELWDSLEHGDDEASVEKAWQAELARRSKDIEEGRAEFVSWEEVKAQIAKRLGEE
jgi:putative addiction module component (TIGR02574 family)